ncbi:MAG: replication protein [Sulfurimonas sp.]|jgi:phage replication O-like protein O
MGETYTKIDNRFMDEVMPTLKSSELACCMAIFRKTSGWGKKTAPVSVDEISKITGITRRHTVLDALNSLADKGIIKATKTAGKTTVYGFCYQLNQNLETSDEKRTSDIENTSAENVTGTSDGKRTSTSDENRTSTSDENRTSSSIYKEKERKRKKRERKRER